MGILVYALEYLKLPPCGRSARGTLTLITTLNAGKSKSYCSCGLHGAGAYVYDIIIFLSVGSLCLA